MRTTGCTAGLLGDKEKRCVGQQNAQHEKGYKLKIVLSIESSRHKQNRGKKPDGSAALARIRSAWREAVTARDDERNRLSGWVAGAVAIYGSITGEPVDVLLKRLEEEMPSGSPATDGTSQSVWPGSQFVEGRSTPAPPRPPGAQRRVE